MVEINKKLLCVLIVLFGFLFFLSCSNKTVRVKGKYSKIEVIYTEEIKNKTITETEEIVAFINGFKGTKKDDAETYYGADIVLDFYDENGEKEGAVIAVSNQITVFGTTYFTDAETVTRLVELCDKIQ